MTKDISKYLEFRENQWGELEQVDLRTGEVVSSSRDIVEVSFSAVLANKICDSISSGKTLKEITTMPNMPCLRTINRWKYHYPLFKEKLDAARRNFSETLIDDAIIAGRDARDADKEEIPGLKLNIDTNIKIAEKFDRERFGNQTKVVGDIDKPVTFKLITGIPTIEEIQESSDEVIEADYKETVLPKEAQVSGNEEDDEGEDAKRKSGDNDDS